MKGWVGCWVSYVSLSPVIMLHTKYNNHTYRIPFLSYGALFLCNITSFKFRLLITTVKSSPLDEISWNCKIDKN